VSKGLAALAGASVPELIEGMASFFIVSV